MKRICFFATYFHGEAFHEYHKIWIRELSRHFEKIVVLVSNDTILKGEKDFLSKNHAELQIEKNEGYDFGLWYKALQKNPVNSYDEWALINDSSVLFRNLDSFMHWAGKRPESVLGITHSLAVAPHLQSYFLWFRKPAFETVIAHFEQTGVLNSLQEVITSYEIGLSKQLAEKGFEFASFVHNDNYRGEFAPYYYCIDSHIRQGIPLIKKRILFESYRNYELAILARMGFILDPSYYIQQIQKIQPETLLPDFERLMKKIEPEISFVAKAKFYFMRSFYKTFRPLYHLLKRK